MSLNLYDALKTSRGGSHGTTMTPDALNNQRLSPDARRAIVVLLVDDQAFVGAAIGRLLATEHDIEFHYCSHPLDAVALANQIGPTVILQDLLMPDMDGFALVQTFRTNPTTSGTPVIVLSGNDDSGARSRALAHGATEYLVKLPGKDTLIACIRRHAAGAILADSPPAAPDYTTAAPPRTADQTFDRGAIEAFRQADSAGSSVFVRALIDQFLDEAASQIASLGEAARRADGDALKAIAHGLKGSAITMGTSKLAALCGQMEHHAARRAGGGVVAVLMADIEKELIHVQAALAAEHQRAEGQ